VSGDGSVIAGKDLATTSEMIGNFRWNAVEGFVALSPVHRSESNGVSVSTDGSVIVGTQTVGNVQAGGYEEAFRWTPQHGVVSLPSLPGASGTQRGWAFAVSDEGTIVGASSESDLWPHIAVRWSADGTISRLFDDGIAAISAATDITPDGSVIVGNGPGAFRWTQAGGVQPLGGFEDVYDTKRATGVSADGSVIVGGADGDVSGQNSFEAFIWDPLHGARRLETVLTELGVDLHGWELTEATGISADGLTIVGVGLAPGATRFQPWVVTIPEPAALAPVLLLVLLVARRRAA
jgi:uncharacterized membrane protein